MEIVIGCAGLGITIIGCAIGVGVKLGTLTTTVSGLDSKLTNFISGRNGGTQCQRHEDEIGTLRRDVDGLKKS